MAGVLPSTTSDGRARATARAAAAASTERTPTSLVSYRSEGSLLIIGPEPYTMSQAETLCDRINCTVLAVWWPQSEDKVEAVRTAPGAKPFEVVRAELVDLTGHLGAFAPTVSVGGEATSLSAVLGRKREHFDLVLDLQRTPHIRREVPPPGYYAPGADSEALHSAGSEIPDMVGEFEKPKYFRYDPDVCAHSRRGIRGCTRCLDACPTGAIASIGETIEVDPYLCQGGGSCATACPTGAITYAFPAVNDLLSVVRSLLQAYREAGGRQPCLLFHDTESGKAWLERIAESVPERCIPVEVEEIGSVGLDCWLTSLAYGASAIRLLCPTDVPVSEREELQKQVKYAHALLAGMGYETQRVDLAVQPTDDEPAAGFAIDSDSQEFTPAGFAPVDEKRTLIRLALDHLFEHAPTPQPYAPLPSGAPFGEIQVDREACTLCMGCVAVCPASALVSGDETPKLGFIEWNCVQCGLCETACPEDAIQRSPRVILDPAIRRETRTLNEEQPFRCIICGKPFATQSVVATIREKLKDHWMFQTPEARRRMEMCEDCRVKDMFQDGGGTLNLHREP